MSDRTLGGRSGPRMILVVLVMGVAAFGVLQSLIVPVLAQIQDELDTDQATVTWVLTAYLVSAAVATPLVGRIGDAVGKQRVLVVIMVLLSAGSVMAALAPTVGWLIVARVVQGVGGGVMPLAFGIIRDEFPRERIGQAVGIIASLMAGAFGLGIVAAGPIVDILGYRWLFWTPAIFTAIAAVGAIVLIPPSPVRTVGRISVLPAALLSGWLVALLLALSEGNDRGWMSGLILGLLVAAAVMFAGWIAAEKTAAVPLIDLDLMRIRGVWTANVVAFIAGVGGYASIAFLPQMMQAPTSTGYGFGATVSESGHVLITSAAVSFVMGFITPRLVRRFTARRVVCTGAVVSGVSYALIAVAHGEMWHLAVWLGLQGFGSGLIASSLAGVVLGSVPPGQTGVASGMNANIRLIGGSLGTALMAGIITHKLGTDGLPLEVSYTTAYVVLAGLSTVAIVAALLIPQSMKQQAAPAVDASEEPDVDLARAQV